MIPPFSPSDPAADVIYKIPEGVHQHNHRNRIQLTTTYGGGIWIDRTILNLWKAANQCRLSEILSDKQFCDLNENKIRFGLACLAEAGLLERSIPRLIKESRHSLQGDLVSIIIVTYNSREWLPGCLKSIAEQSYSPIEIIIIDNASQDGSADWVKENASHVILVSNKRACSLAGALNNGIKLANGSYILLLNPDVVLDPSAIELMIQTALLNPSCAAVAAKLKLLWAPSFLNGLGNLVGPFSWGADIGLGHLDLGQFDRVTEIPSACFAAALIARDKFHMVGPFDEGFPIYYEDSEWCYRARLMGFSILAAPQARCLHAFGSRLPSMEGVRISADKLRMVTFGRLRFITRINSRFEFWKFLLAYFCEDFFRGLVYLIAGKLKLCQALLRGWSDYLDQLPKILNTREDIQSRRIVSDRDLFGLQKSIQAPLMQAGLPVLTWDVICNEYAPLINTAKISFPEFSNGDGLGMDILSDPVPLWKRAYRIWKVEGLDQLLYWSARKIQWRLARS